MTFGRYCFCPPWWGIALFVFGVALFGSLGVWQIERAHYKEGLVAEQRAAREAGTRAMHPDQAAGGSARNGALRYGRAYRARGHYDTQHQILLADQLHGTRTGYRVWTPFVLDSGIRVMVDRGWVARPGRGQPLPDPPAPTAGLQVKGFWVALPRPVLAWGASTSCKARSWPRVLSYPDAATLRCQYSAPVLDGLLLLDPAQPHGFVRQWQDAKDVVGLSPFAHYAYASQWFLMAFVAGVILVVVNLRRR